MYSYIAYFLECTWVCVCVCLSPWQSMFADIWLPGLCCVSDPGLQCVTSSTMRRNWRRTKKRWHVCPLTRRSSLYASCLPLFSTSIFISVCWCLCPCAHWDACTGRNDWNAVAVLSGAVGAMAESEFQWSLHCLDSHKSSAGVCGVSVEVRQLRPDSQWCLPASVWLPSFLYSSVHLCYRYVS